MDTDKLKTLARAAWERQFPHWQDTREKIMTYICIWRANKDLEFTKAFCLIRGQQKTCYRITVYKMSMSSYAVCQCGNWRSQEWLPTFFRVSQGILSEERLSNLWSYPILKLKGLARQQHTLLRKNNGSWRVVTQGHSRNQMIFFTAETFRTTDGHW